MDGPRSNHTKWSQKKKDKYHICYHICYHLYVESKYGKNERIYQTDRLTGIENSCVVAKEVKVGKLRAGSLGSAHANCHIHRRDKQQDPAA